MGTDKNGKIQHRKCDNCSETELTLDCNFNYPAIILNLWKIGILPTGIDLYEYNTELILKKIDVHDHIYLSFLTMGTTKNVIIISFCTEHFSSEEK